MRRPQTSAARWRRGERTEGSRRRRATRRAAIRLRRVLAVAALAIITCAAPAHAQPGAVVPPQRVAILQAEERRAATPHDLQTLRSGVRSRDPLTAILAIRAIGRLERPSLIADLLPALNHALPEARAEAANALGQAAQGWTVTAKPSGTHTPASLLATLAARLEAEEETSVRAALSEAIGRLPYRAAEEVQRAAAALVALEEGSDEIGDRLGVAKGLEALLRLHRDRGPAGAAALAALRRLAGADDQPPRSESEALRDSRVRRLALEALITAGALDEDVVVRAAADPDVQVRRLAMRASLLSGTGTGVLAIGLEDPAAIVRIEALRGFRHRTDDGACHAFVDAAGDEDAHVALIAIDQLAGCSTSPEAIAVLERLANDRVQVDRPRGWHRAAHAIVALAAAAPDRAAPALQRFVAARSWQLRVHGARAAMHLRDRAALEALAVDPDDNVVEAAVEGLSKLIGHDGDAVYRRALARTGYQAIRAAALALDGTPDATSTIPALTACWQRLTDEGRANSVDTRAVIAATLVRLGAPAPKAAHPAPTAPSLLTAADLRRLAAPRARLTIRDAGTFEIALFTSEAPATVLRFASLAESGYYAGLTFHRVVPNFVIQGGSPAANEYVGFSDFMRDEVGLWPHVRGAVGLSTRGRDTGDAQFFVNLVDNPRFDHEYTVFGQVLNGIDVVDRILEGDVIERIEILP